MTDWQPIETAPKNEVILLGCESDPFGDSHMFYVGLGWAYEDGFWSVADDDIRFYSHWAKITSPIPGAAVMFHKNSEYYKNKISFFDTETWIETQFSGHGVAVRKMTDAPIPGEPFMSMEVAKEIVRNALRR